MSDSDDNLFGNLSGIDFNDDELDPIFDQYDVSESDLADVMPGNNEEQFAAGYLPPLPQSDNNGRMPNFNPNRTGFFVGNGPENESPAQPSRRRPRRRASSRSSRSSSEGRRPPSRQEIRRLAEDALVNAADPATFQGGNFGLVVDDARRAYVSNAKFDRTRRRTVQIKGVEKQINMKGYLNRHLVFPEEGNEEAYYRIDVKAKNKKHRGRYVQIVGYKWLPTNGKISWKCVALDTKERIFSQYINGLTRQLKDSDQTKRWLKNKKLVNRLIITNEDLQVFETTLQNLTRQLQRFRMQMEDQRPIQ